MTSDKIILTLDPSGNYTEGKGTTGWCAANDGYVFSAGQIYAAEYPSQMDYWKAIVDLILKYVEEEHESFTVVCEDYRLYASASQAQINSNMETPQLIGVIKWICYITKTPIVLQMASEVKQRWSNEILIRENIISKNKNGKGWYCGKIELNDHSLDALRHCLHYCTFKINVRNKKPKTYNRYLRAYYEE